MVQEEVYQFLKKRRGNFYTAKQIGVALGISDAAVRLQLKKLQRWHKDIKVRNRPRKDIWRRYYWGIE